jgi:uncharacterized membrane protein YkvA (DUF1232 family)
MILFITVISTAVTLWGVAVLALWLQRNKADEAIRLIQQIPNSVRYAREMLKDSTTSRKSKLALIGLIAYLLSPIDLIPDFIPVVGQLDDILLVFLVLRYCEKQRTI